MIQWKLLVALIERHENYAKLKRPLTNKLMCSYDQIKLFVRVSIVLILIVNVNLGILGIGSSGSTSGDS